MFKRIVKSFTNHGCFNLRKRQNVSAIAKANDTPNLPGVYIVYAKPDRGGEILYIGKAGTLLNDGTMKNQGILKRMGTKQNKIPRNRFFKNVMNSRDSDISFAWYVTFDDTHCTLPSLVEAQLLQVYFDHYERLPRYNKEF